MTPSPPRILATQTLYYPVQPGYSIAATTVVLWETPDGTAVSTIGHGEPAWVVVHGRRLSTLLARSYFPAYIGPYAEDEPHASVLPALSEYV